MACSHFSSDTTGAASDAASDTTSDGADASFCAQTDAYFCADFDRDPDPASGWTMEDLIGGDAGSISLDDANVVSPPYSGLFWSGPVDAGSSGGARLLRTLLGASGGRGAVCELSVLTLAPSTSGSARMVSLSMKSAPGAGPGFFEATLARTTFGGYEVLHRTQVDAGEGRQQLSAGDGIGIWHDMVITVDMTSLAVTIDGQAMMSPLPHGVAPPFELELYVGSYIFLEGAAAPSAGARFAFDNVVCRITP
jgi:hypothetical protein